jgi:hypothetical protein
MLKSAAVSNAMQRGGSPIAHRATIRKQDSAGARNARNRPFGIVAPRIARAEAFVEALVALNDCSDVERRIGMALGYIERTRSRIEAQYARSAISFELFARHLHALDKIETRLAIQLINHSARIRRDVIPDAQRGYESAERAA